MMLLVFIPKTLKLGIEENMGGWGSGGGRNATKTTDLRKIDLADLKRLNLLRPMGRRMLNWSWNGEEVASIQLEYQHSALSLIYRVRNANENWTSINEKVPLARTRQNFGGERIWFECLSCRRRCRVIYGGEYFRCRICYQATYSSQYENKMDRLLSQAQDVRMKLGGSGSLDEPFPKKLKWMRWKTYDRLQKSDKNAITTYWIEAARLLGSLDH